MSILMGGAGDGNLPLIQVITQTTATFTVTVPGGVVWAEIEAIGGGGGPGAPFVPGPAGGGGGGQGANTRIKINVAGQVGNTIVGVVGTGATTGFGGRTIVNAGTITGMTNFSAEGGGGGQDGQFGGAGALGGTATNANASAVKLIGGNGGSGSPTTLNGGTGGNAGTATSDVNGTAYGTGAHGGAGVTTAGDGVVAIKWS